MRTTTKFDLAIAQFIGFYHGKDNRIIPLVESMGLSKKEWIKIKTKEAHLLSENETQEIDEYFNSLLG